MNGRRTSSRRASAAETLASCIRLIVPSIMRAPPEQETITSGSLRSMARSTAQRHFFADHRAHRAADEAELHRAADHRPPGEQAFGGDDGVGTCPACGAPLSGARRRACVSMKCSGSFDASPASCSIQRASSSSSSRCVALSRKWCWHLGQTRAVGFQVLLPDDGAAVVALGPQPFGLDAPLVGRSGLIDRFFFPFEPSHESFRPPFRGLPIPSLSIIDAALREDALGVRMLDLAHFRHQIGGLHQSRMGVAPRADHVHALGAAGNAATTFSTSSIW